MSTTTGFQEKVAITHKESEATGKGRLPTGPHSRSLGGRGCGGRCAARRGGARTYFLGCGCNSCSLQVESHTAQDALVGRNVHRRLLGTGQVHELHMARVRAREGQKGVVTVGAQDAEA